MKDNEFLPTLATGADIHRNYDEKQYLKELNWEEFFLYIEEKEE